MRKYCIALMAMALMVFASACSQVAHLSSERVVVTPQSPICIMNLKKAREFVANERYELAREYYLNALAASDDTNREAISAELHAVDMMVKGQR